MTEEEIKTKRDIYMTNEEVIYSDKLAQTLAECDELQRLLTMALDERDHYEKKCKEVGNHKSDCAVYNEPAYPKGECDCVVSPRITKQINPLDLALRYGFEGDTLDGNHLIKGMFAPWDSIKKMALDRVMLDEENKRLRIEIMNLKQCK